MTQKERARISIAARREIERFTHTEKFAPSQATKEQRGECCGERCSQREWIRGPDQCCHSIKVERTGSAPESNQQDHGKEKSRDR